MKAFTEKEKRYCHTYNHMVSKRVVQFALKYKAKYINLENLKGFDTSKKILRNWSYYELQDMITYKAKFYGIEVRKINPAYTSQTCSICGSKDKAQRKKQDLFICNNPNCESHVIYKRKNRHGNEEEYLNADFNAARNIAMSTEFVDDNKEEK